MEEISALVDRGRLGGLRGVPPRFADRYSSIPGLEDAAQAELLAETPYLLTELAKLPEGYGREVRSHVARIARRMQLWVADHDDGNQLRLRRLQQLDHYR